MALDKIPPNKRDNAVRQKNCEHPTNTVLAVPKQWEEFAINHEKVGEMDWIDAVETGWPPPELVNDGRLE